MPLSTSTRLVRQSQKVDILSIDNRFASAEVSLFGGHLLSFKPKSDNRERIWLSEKAIMDGSKAIRGGVPICWPWFGNHPDSSMPAHGYVRTQQWQLNDCVDGEFGTRLSLSPTFSNGAGLDGQAKLVLNLMIGAQLSIELITENIGSNDFDYSCALHSYFAIDDIQHTRLSGLSGDYLDKMANNARLPSPQPYVFTAETDRVQLNPVEKVVIENVQKPISIHSKGHDSLVIWNPWIEKTAGMSDMPNDGYKTMLCVETALTQQPILAAGSSHSMMQIIS